MHPIQLGNWLLIVLGIGMIVCGPWMVVSAIKSEIRSRALKAKSDWFNTGFNLIVGPVLFLAGILFVINNLRGNPLA